MRVPKKNSLLYIRAIQGHTGGKLIAPELLGHVGIPYNWKEFPFSQRKFFPLYFNSQVRTRMLEGEQAKMDDSNRMSSTEDRRWPTDGLRSTATYLDYIMTIERDNTTTW